jgi:hypothetical protein
MVSIASCGNGAADETKGDGPVRWCAPSCRTSSPPQSSRRRPGSVLVRVGLLVVVGRLPEQAAHWPATPLPMLSSTR